MSDECGDIDKSNGDRSNGKLVDSLAIYTGTPAVHHMCYCIEAPSDNATRPWERERYTLLLL